MRQNGKSKRKGKRHYNVGYLRRGNSEIAKGDHDRCKRKRHENPDAKAQNRFDEIAGKQLRNDRRHIRAAKHFDRKYLAAAVKIAVIDNKNICYYHNERERKKKPCKGVERF